MKSDKKRGEDDLPRIIFHVDLDAYYASLAIRANPEYVGRPVIIGPDPRESKGRGVVLTCSYEARQFGIHSGMPISKAQQLCSDAVYSRVDWDDIRETSRRVHSLLEDFADDGLYQAGGCDEGYLDVTQRAYEHRCPIDYAKQIQQTIMAKEKLSCSIGIGPNKMVAKIASDFKKPAGITKIEPNEVLEFLGELPVRKLIGVGAKTEKRLQKLGIQTIEDIRDKQAVLRKKLGFRSSEWLIQASLGNSSAQIHTSKHGLFHGRKSIGHERTRRFENWSEIEETVRSLTIDNCKRAHRRGFSFRTVTIKLRFADFDTHTKSASFAHSSTSTRKAIQAAMELLQNFRVDSQKRKIRLVGSRLSGLQRRTKPLTAWLPKIAPY
ncbi:MAG: DNA polymerase IV [Candidatus Heimdallarchaeota archaeon]